MAVLPEEMDRLDVEDTTGSLRKIEEYIHYMTERIEFGMRNMTKTVTASGVSTTEVYILLVAMDNRLSALESTVNSLRASINSQAGLITQLQGRADNLETGTQALSESVTQLAGRVNGLDTATQTVSESVSALLETVEDLADRVTALENPQTPGTEP